MYPVGTVVKFTFKEKDHVGMIYDAAKHFERECDYYDGHEISNKLKSIRYSLLYIGEKGIQTLGIDTDDPSFKNLTEIKKPSFRVELGDGNTAITNDFAELRTICNAYDMAHLKYDVFMKIK